MKAFQCGPARFVSFGDDQVCLDVVGDGVDFVGNAGADVDAESEIQSDVTDWSVPKQTALLFSNGAHRETMVSASKYTCGIDGQMTFRALVLGESKWKVTPSYTCSIEFFVFDPTTGAFGFMPAAIEPNSTKLKNCAFELEKSSTKKKRFPESYLKMFAGNCEFTLQSTTDQPKDFSDLRFLFSAKMHDDDPESFRACQTVAILVESFEAKIFMDQPISTMHQCGLMLAATYRICGRYMMAKMIEPDSDDVTEANEFVAKHENKSKVSAKAIKDANFHKTRLNERLRVHDVDGTELKSSQAKNAERRRLLAQLERFVNVPP